ncbi:MAG: Asp23/Gls24 family envelope stress response protein [Oscillospiraceae bacterium]|nr:Asp23/Gls24 family envelope stress response protein [Oscillospiraceae bacterium]
MAENKGYIRNADDMGSINISDEVVAVIAAAAAAEVEGVHGPYVSHGMEFAGIRGRKGLAKGVKLCIDNDDEVSIDINIIVEIGYSVSEVGEAVQKAVVSAVEDAVGAKVGSVNINVCGISLKKKAER